MTKISVFVWFVVIGVSFALDPSCDDFGSCNRTHFNNDKSKNDTISQQTISNTTSLAIPKNSTTIPENKNERKLFMPTLPPLSEEAKGRSMNMENELMKNITKNEDDKIEDLSDVGLTGDDEDTTIEPDEEMYYPNISLHNHAQNITDGSCLKDGIRYADGETSIEDCDSMCTCVNRKMICDSRCTKSLIKRGKEMDDPNCSVQDSEDICCLKVTCSDTAYDAIQPCHDDTKTYSRGERMKDDCEELCYCGQNGTKICKDRCPKTKRPSDKCFEIQDTKDPCCKKVLCDVDQDNYKILSAKYVNDTSIKIEFLNISHINEVRPDVGISTDKKKWYTYKLPDTDYLSNIDKKPKYIRIEDGEELGEIIEIQGLSPPETLTNVSQCTYKGKKYKLDEEFPDDCELFCVCRESGVKCFKYECPTYSGVDILDSSCVQWETIPANFTPTPPKCCPEKLRCKSHGECEYENKRYSNWQEIPASVTGCEKRCYCEMGKVECQEVCPPVVATPPITLPCLPHQATLKHPPGEDCCLDWVCESTNSITGFPPGYFNNYNGLHQQQDEVIIRTLEPTDSRTVRLIFDIPHIIVGLYGRVEVRYTDKEDTDPNSWLLQVFAPPNDLLATPQLEFQLTQLRPDTEYSIQITVTLRDMHNVHTSKIYNVHTPKDISSSIDPELRVVEVNSSWARIQWRPFTEYELEFIDGVQLRYKELDGMIFEATPYIHRSVTNYTLENLKYKTTYVVQVTFIPFHDQSVELHSDQMVNFTTLSEVNAYDFNVTLELTRVKSTSVEISWLGVPYPEDKYVNIYRAIYQADKNGSSMFKVAQSDSSSVLMITNLNPGTRYKLWLEMYLTNGKTKTSNVLDIYTKPGYTPTLGASAKDKLSGDISEDREDYYGPLVIVAILATIAILSTLVLLLILVKRHSQNKASITQPPRVSQSAYDNPTYKVEIQQETMNL